MTTLLLALALLTPLPLHTETEQKLWEIEWQEKVVENGILTPDLVAEYVDFQTRHIPPPPVVATPQVQTQTSSYSVSRGMGSNVEQWRGLVSNYFTEVDRALCIMAAESGGNPNAVNPSSGAAGLFQVMPFWWDHFGGDRFNPETNVRVAAEIWRLQGWGAWSPWNRGMCR